MAGNDPNAQRAMAQAMLGKATGSVASGTSGAAPSDAEIRAHQMAGGSGTHGKGVFGTITAPFKWAKNKISSEGPNKTNRIDPQEARKTREDALEAFDSFLVSAGEELARDMGKVITEEFLTQVITHTEQNAIRDAIANTDSDTKTKEAVHLKIINEKNGISKSDFSNNNEILCAITGLVSIVAGSEIAQKAAYAFLGEQVVFEKQEVLEILSSSFAPAKTFLLYEIPKHDSTANAIESVAIVHGMAFELGKAATENMVSGAQALAMHSSIKPSRQIIDYSYDGGAGANFEAGVRNETRKQERTRQEPGTSPAIKSIKEIKGAAVQGKSASSEEFSSVASGGATISIDSAKKVTTDITRGFGELRTAFFAGTEVKPPMRETDGTSEAKKKILAALKSYDNFVSVFGLGKFSKSETIIPKIEEIITEINSKKGSGTTSLTPKSREVFEAAVKKLDIKNPDLGLNSLYVEAVDGCIEEHATENAFIEKYPFFKRALGENFEALAKVSQEHPGVDWEFIGISKKLFGKDRIRWLKGKWVKDEKNPKKSSYKKSVFQKHPYLSILATPFVPLVLGWMLAMPVIGAKRAFLGVKDNQITAIQAVTLPYTGSWSLAKELWTGIAPPKAAIAKTKTADDTRKAKEAEEKIAVQAGAVSGYLDNTGIMDLSWLNNEQKSFLLKNPEARLLIETEILRPQFDMRPANKDVAGIEKVKELVGRAIGDADLDAVVKGTDFSAAFAQIAEIAPKGKPKYQVLAPQAGKQEVFGKIKLAPQVAGNPAASLEAFKAKFGVEKPKPKEAKAKVKPKKQKPEFDF